MDEAAKLSNVDCILVLGCQVKGDKTPSDMLADRLHTGVSAYQSGVSHKLLMSGDHSTAYYNEVEAMRDYALNAHVPSKDIFLDHAGLSTYESMYRANKIFGAKKIVVVTQSYHLYRAIYIGRKMGMTVYGISADSHRYRGQSIRDLREFAARAKDWAITWIMPEPTYLGDEIDLSGDGNVTADKETSAE